MAKKKNITFTEQEDTEFKQIVVIIQNLIWLGLEYLWLEWETPIKFRIIRVIFFMFLGIARIECVENPDTSLNFWPSLWKVIKVMTFDFLSLIFLIWAFGRSFL